MTVAYPYYGDDENFEDTSYRSYRNNSDFFPRRDY
jgi:hypothetical protein